MNDPNDPIEQLIDILKESTRTAVRAQDIGISLATSVMVNFMAATPDYEDKFAEAQKGLNDSEMALITFCYSKALMLLLSHANYPNESASKIDQMEAWFVDNWDNPVIKDSARSLTGGKLRDPLVLSVVTVICSRLAHFSAVRDHDGA